MKNLPIYRVIEHRKADTDTGRTAALRSKIAAILSGAAATFWRQYGLFFAIVAAAVALDVVTGLVKAKATGEGLSSAKAMRGFYKKLSLFAALLFGIFLDFAAGAVIVRAGVTVNADTPFALIVSAYIIINEAISIAENLYLTNPDSFPKWISARLLVAREQLQRQDSSEKNVKK